MTFELPSVPGDANHRRDNTGRWTYESSLDALVPIELIQRTQPMLVTLGYGPTDFIWEKLRGTPTFVLRGPSVLAGVNASPGNTKLTAVEALLDEAESGQEIVLLSAWGCTPSARRIADRLQVALFRYTALDRCEPFKNTALTRVHARRPTPGPLPPGN